MSQPVLLPHLALDLSQHEVEGEALGKGGLGIFAIEVGAEEALSEIKGDRGRHRRECDRGDSLKLEFGYHSV